MTAERQNELQRQIDRRFDQFSLDELKAADSGAMTFGLAFPEISVREREFAQGYFTRKIDELRSNFRAEDDSEHPCA